MSLNKLEKLGHQEINQIPYYCKKYSSIRNGNLSVQTELS
jgi:hypothetical protein